MHNNPVNVKEFGTLYTLALLGINFQHLTLCINVKKNIVFSSSEDEKTGYAFASIEEFCDHFLLDKHARTQLRRIVHEWYQKRLDQVKMQLDSIKFEEDNNDHN